MFSVGEMDKQSYAVVADIILWHQVECASLNQELQDMENRVRRGQKKSPEEASQVIQVSIINCKLGLFFVDIL